MAKELNWERILQIYYVSVIKHYLIKICVVERNLSIKLKNH